MSNAPQAPRTPAAPALKHRVWSVFRLFTGFLGEFLYVAALERLFGARLMQRTRHRLYARQAERFRARSVELGGLLIKLGQFLSARVDLLPTEYTEILSSLQDHVPAVPWHEAAQVLDDLGPDWRERLFSFFDEQPVAAASFGQVHRGVLHDGREVAVKLQRPGIEAYVEADLTAVSWFLELLERFTTLMRHMDVWAVYREFEETTRDELDYAKEAQNARVFKKNLSKLPGVVVPEVIDELCHGRVLGLQFMHGIKISDYTSLSAAGISRRQAAEHLVAAYMQMVLEDGFFHADPHPGNIFVDLDGRLVLVDFGMVGRITPVQMQELRRLFVAIAQRREGQIVEAFDRLGFLRPTADFGAVKRAVRILLDRFYSSSLQELYSIDPGALAQELQELIRKQPFQVPTNVAFLGRALSILVGVSTGLDPTLNLVGIFEPYARRLVTEGGEEPLWQEVFKKLQKSLLALAELPELAATALDRQRSENGQELSVAIAGQAHAARAMTRAIYVALFLLLTVALAVTGHSFWAVLAGLATAVSFFAAGRNPHS